VKPSTRRGTPIIIASGVVLAFWILQVIRPAFIEKVEALTYDLRVLQAAGEGSEVATNLGFVSISDDSIAFVNRGLLERRYGLYWPRHIYARVTDELNAQGAKAIALDVLFPDLRRDHFPLIVNGTNVDSDDFFAERMRNSGNVILASDKGVLPAALFRNSALAMGDITVDRDSDGVLRRARAFRTYRLWHTAFRQVEADPDFDVDLRNARVDSNKIVLVRSTLDPITIPLEKDGTFDLKLFAGDTLPAGMARFAKPFTEERIWHLGITLAAQELKLDLAHAEVDLGNGRITLRGANGVKRVIPVDQDGNFYINWRMKVNDPNLEYEPIEGLLAQYQMRPPADTNHMTAVVAERWKNKIDHWRGRLVVIGSVAVSNDLTDRGATPLEQEAVLVSEHWNVANSILKGQFVRRGGLGVELLAIALLGAAAAWITSSFRSYVATSLAAAMVVLYLAATVYAYNQFLYWLPVVLPTVGGVAVMHGSLLAYLVIFEQTERRRLRSVFTKMVPQEVVNEIELLASTDKLSLRGARRNVTVFFADIRGFTEMTDINRDKAAEYVKEHNLTGQAAEAVFDARAAEALDTVNIYLTVVAEIVQQNKGAVDKFIGDCVMAFWGAPTPNPKHALCCVQAAIAAQRAVFELNLKREAENRRREQENVKLAAAGLEPLSMLPVLVIGTGINTGVVTAGYMGSEERLNYTVFGGDVNLASRLESVSGRARIIISEATLAEIIQDDPTLALSCIQLPPVKVKGIREPVPIYEVPWRESGAPAPDGPATTSTGDTMHITAEQVSGPDAPAH
jgi:class 3 adenylate cyclase/CHASE2 domain-containing sensor protein